jgi:D-amino-acid dehydrogenase
VAEEAAEIGVEARVLDAGETAALDPDVRMDVAGSVYFPQDSHLDPARFLAGLRKRIREGGGEIVGGVEIDAIERVAGRVTAVSGGGRVFSGDQFVIAGGVWSAGLVRGLGLRLPMQAGKGYSLTLAEPVQMPKLCSILAEARVAVTPMGGRLRFAGTMEIGGLGMESDPRRVRGIVRSVPGYFPEFREEDFSNTRPWVGLRPVSPDGLPYLGRAPGCENAIVAAGHGMLGLSLGPVTGKLVAEMLEGVETSVDVGRLGVGRFG